MSLLRHVTGIGPGRSRSALPLDLSTRHSRRGGVGNARRLIGRDVSGGALRRRIPVWLIPGISVGAVFAALAIAHVRVELIDQGYKRYSAVERLQALEEEKRALTARVGELRDPARLARLAQKMGLARPDHVITLAAPGDELRP